MREQAEPFRLGEVGGEGPAALLLHRLTGTPHDLRALGEALAAGGVAVVGPALPAHPSNPEARARVARADWLDAGFQAHTTLAQTHGRVYAVGHSLGGIPSRAPAVGWRRAAGGASGCPSKRPLAAAAAGGGGALGPPHP